MPNIYVQIRELLGPGRLEIGKVLSVANGTAVIELTGGGIIHARGTATVNTRVYVQDGVIQGEAPNRPVQTGTV
ncbi:hypothetical protein D3C72_1876070 [compost metagenome]